ncbi:MAG: hydrogenase maturation protease [Capsulimonadaceae bacterium]
MNQRPREILVIGYGNTLRRDDGAGERVAEAVSSLDLPHVRVIVAHQLMIEFAEDLARAGQAIFCDAMDAGSSEKARAMRLRPASGREAFAHAPSPAGLLALARALYGRCAAAWVVTVPGWDFAFGEGLSPAATAQIPAAAELVRRMCDRPQPRDIRR